ncbi:uncharacterized protein LOC131466408 [Solea solea]|uniref:uncharacterized protein LOC131466408 n=1 Tax=Solea solea TaxID=90069 RepID=UPI00272DB4AE|nr:uncharacterized protein LOC131466408 [Solea solea]XP_058495586.1 uncharacterized protein LOC131466408 [Solea solea]XP_058495588.1 uncharacterized protein LOC131466408 [Solea solea]XP_058495589.1 uncharacterized protein LOC131466408 [Solea solea]
MERNKEIPVLLLALLRVCLAWLESCPSQPALPTDLTCYTDYNTTINCAWNITKESNHRDAACTLLSTHKYKKKTVFTASCRMEPADVSNQNIRRCTLDFKAKRRFTVSHNLSMSLSCDPGKHIFTVYFRPACNIKLNPPGRPDVNFTTVSWLLIFGKDFSLKVFTSELQWKTQDQSWSDPSVQKQQTKTTSCKSKCEAQLDPESLVQGETYEARIRVQPDQVKTYMSVWSDWGPTASWESPVGRIKPTQPPDFVRDVAIIITGATLALFLAGILFKNDKAIWVYRKMRGQPPPDPGKSSLKDLNLQHWSPYFPRESLHSSLKTEDINSVEVISTMDNDTLCSKEVALLDKMRKERMRIESTSSSFSNPIYSQLCPPPPPDAMGTAESLEPCDNDPCNSSTGCQDKGKSAEKNEEEERMQEMQIVQLLSKRKNNNSEQVQVVSGYEKVEKLQAERFRLQSLDSGVCSGEEVSHESLETDSVNVSDGHEEGPECREVVNEKEVIFQKLFRGDGGSVVGKGSVQVCSDYEQVHKLQASSPELLSVDSGVNSGGEEQVSHEESLEDIDSSTETTHFLFPPPTRCILPCAVPSFSQMSLSETDVSRTLQPSSLSQIVGKAAMLSLSRSMETSGDGYMPVRQESG